MIAGERKIPGGKLVRVEAELNGSVRKVRITGDFFVHPEEAISEMEACLQGLSAAAAESEILQRLEAATRSAGAVLVGFSEKDVAEILAQALREARGK